MMMNANECIIVVYVSRNIDEGASGVFVVFNVLCVDQVLNLRLDVFNISLELADGVNTRFNDCLLYHFLMSLHDLDDVCLNN